MILGVHITRKLDPNHTVIDSYVSLNPRRRRPYSLPPAAVMAASPLIGDAGDLESILRLKDAEPFQFLNADAELAEAARGASRQLFAALAPSCPSCPVERLLVQGFDAEQIWQQIDLQTHSLVSRLRRRLNGFKRRCDEVTHLLKPNLDEGSKVIDEVVEELEDDGEEMIEEDGNEDEEEEEEEEEDDDDGEEEEGDGLRDVEDEFLKIKDQEWYFEKAEMAEQSGEDDEDEDEEEEDDDDDFIDNIRYDDFFGSKGKKSGEKKSKRHKVKDTDSDEDFNDGEDAVDGEDLDGQKEKVLSTHEKQLEKFRSKIKQMEKANLDPKTWTMQGEVTASKRPKNSALEVDLDFEHNMRPAPVITEEVTASIEDLIKRRILEGHFDDVQKPRRLLTDVRKELKELDERKSKKGLGEIYEEDYAQKTGLAPVSLSHTDEQKKEASLLFKGLCLKLDALAHFHFAPKPVIEDMSVQSNLPALAMEEVAPLAVSDAAMLAPEEIFSGKGYIKENGELTQADRKRRRAKKKRNFKGEALKRSTSKQTHAKEF